MMHRLTVDCALVRIDDVGGHCLWSAKRLRRPVWCRAHRVNSTSAREPKQKRLYITRSRFVHSPPTQHDEYICSPYNGKPSRDSTCRLDWARSGPRLNISRKRRWPCL